MIKFSFYIFISLCFLFAPVSGYSKDILKKFGLIHEEAIYLGERIYREGILSNGNQAMAIVQDDITIEGPMLTCAHCHLRSGLGDYEGKVYTLSINAERLFKPMLKGPERRLKPLEELPPWFKYGMLRPAYNDATLAKAIKYGEDPYGRVLSPTMPRYILDDRDMELLIYYLKNLNPKLSPGVDDYYISFATIVTDDVPKELKDTIIYALKSIVEANNAQTRHQEKRAKKGPWTEENMNFFYRRYKLYVWELKGDADSWYDQLVKYYKKNPVFAILSGISTMSWEPIHRFCEDYRIPNIFPITDMPVISNNDWYTLYFSKGYYQEGELIAKFLNNLSLENEHVIVINDDSKESNMLTSGFLEQWLKYNGNFKLIKLSTIMGLDLQKIIKRSGYKIMLLFIKKPEFFKIISKIDLPEDFYIFSSSTLIGEDFINIPDKLKSNFYFTYPYSVEETGNDQLIEKWAFFMKIKSKKKDILSKIYTLGNILTDTFMMLKGNFYRDYFLDIIDMQRDRVPPFTNYDRLSFGQGQRYASKGGYIVKVNNDGILVKQNEWIIY